VQGITRVAEIYYDWSGGRALFGRDAIANMFIAASKSFGIEIFEVYGGIGTINVDRDVMRQIWDNYYVPYISGYFFSYGRFRSDDAKVGDILMYVGSTSSAAFFPSEVTVGGSVYPVTAMVLPVPFFEGGENVMVQQGAGMVVTESTPEQEYASVEFLKWFTGTQQNINFAVSTGYIPVRVEALDYELMRSLLAAGGIEVAPIVYETLSVALMKVNTSELYTNRAFGGGADARKELESHLQDKASADRLEVIALIEGGMPHGEAVALFNTEELFSQWVDDLAARLRAAVGLDIPV
jgi:multiple sugar transport system substrate-binding protein